MKLLLIVTISLLAQCVTPSKILVLTFFSSKSHKITYMPLIEELASRGHEITIVTPVKADKAVKNIKEIFTIDMESNPKFKLNPFETKESGENLLLQLIAAFSQLCHDTYDLQRVQDLLKEDFDLIFMQPLFNDCALGLVHLLKAPLVLFYPAGVPDAAANKLGAHFPPSFVPNPMLGFNHEMNFFQRFVNFGANAFFEGAIKFWYEPNQAAIYREKLNDDTIPLPSVILGNASLILSNSHFSVRKPIPYLPDIIDVGGIHSRPAKPLPKELEEFVTKGKDGFILFSMGSAIKGDQMPESRRKMFLKVFSKLKQQVLWKWESESMPDLPKNVKLSKWLPQQDLLGHKDIKMFITHCGGGSTEEAIYHGVPLLGFPMFGDQPHNAQTAKNNGFLFQLEWNDLTEENLLGGINEVLNNPTYRQNVKTLSASFKDQPDDPLKRGVYWVEYILRHKGAPQLRSASRKLNYFQYHSYDVIGAYLAIIYGILKLLCFIMKFIGRKVCGCGGGSKKKAALSPSKKKN